MLGKNWNIITTYSPLQPIAMPPVQNNSVVPKKQASKVWRYLGDNLDGAIAKCLLCKYNPTKGDAHKSSLVNRYSSSQVQPWSSRFAKAPPKPWETTCKHKTRGIWWRRRSRRHPALKRQDRLGKEPFAGFGTVVEDITESGYTKNQPILLGFFWENAFFVFLHYKINGSKGVFWP